MQRNRRMNKEDLNKPKEKTTTRMTLVDLFRNDDDHENHSKEDLNKPKEKTTTHMALVDHFRNDDDHENHSKEDLNKPKEKTTTRMALVDHFRIDDGHENHSMKTRVGLLLPTKPKRVGLKMISGGFGKKKAEECCFSDSKKGGEGNENGGADCKQCTTKSQQRQTSLALKVPAGATMEQLSSFKNLFGNKKRVGFGFGFLRCKKKGGCRDCTSASENGIGGREENSGQLKRVSLRITIQRLKIGGSTREKSSSSSIKKIEKEGTVGNELCKIRILMGERCKPLTLSGTLHYDQDGILLPDLLP